MGRGRKVGLAIDEGVVEPPVLDVETRSGAGHPQRVDPDAVELVGVGRIPRTRPHQMDAVQHMPDHQHAGEVVPVAGAVRVVAAIQHDAGGGVPDDDVVDGVLDARPVAPGQLDADHPLLDPQVMQAGVAVRQQDHREVVAIRPDDRSRSRSIEALTVADRQGRGDPVDARRHEHRRRGGQRRLDRQRIVGDTVADGAEVLDRGDIRQLVADRPPDGARSRPDEAAQPLAVDRRRHRRVAAAVERQQLVRPRRPSGQQGRCRQVGRGVVQRRQRVVGKLLHAGRQVVVLVVERAGRQGTALQEVGHPLIGQPPQQRHLDALVRRGVEGHGSAGRHPAAGHGIAAGLKCRVQMDLHVLRREDRERIGEGPLGLVGDSRCPRGGTGRRS